MPVRVLIDGIRSVEQPVEHAAKLRINPRLATRFRGGFNFMGGVRRSARHPLFHWNRRWIKTDEGQNAGCEHTAEACIRVFWAQGVVLLGECVGLVKFAD